MSNRGSQKEGRSDSKYRAVMMVMSSGGLRITEACQLRADDIDSKRMLIHVRDGNGNRDPYTLLSHRALNGARTGPRFGFFQV